MWKDGEEVVVYWLRPLLLAETPMRGPANTIYFKFLRRTAFSSGSSAQRLVFLIYTHRFSFKSSDICWMLKERVCPKERSQDQEGQK